MKTNSHLVLNRLLVAIVCSLVILSAAATSLQRSTNLQVWEPWQTITLTDSSLEIIDGTQCNFSIAFTVSSPIETTMNLHHS